MIRKSLVILAAVIASSCGALAGGTINVDPAPHPRPVAIRTCVAGAQVQLADGAAAFTTDAAGDVSVNISGDAFNLHVRADGLPPYDQVVTFTSAGPKQLLLGPCVPLTDEALQMVLAPWVTADTGERGRVHVEGDRFVREDGSTFPWRGFTAFRLYEQWLVGGAATIDPVVRDWLTCGGLCNARGPNVVRVLGMVDSFAHLWPQEHGERYYSELGPFVDHLWTAFHLRLEFVVFADAQIVMADPGAQDVHLQNVMAVLASRQNVFVEIANEVFKNLPGGADRAVELGRRYVGRGPPIASGDYGDIARTALDYVTVHTSRDAEWPRKVKDLLDIHDGLARKPIVGDEPMGFAEIERPGSRSASVDDAAQFAATCQLFAAGCTMHTDAGIAFGPLGPVQAAAAGAFFQAMDWVPPDAQFAQYTRGGESAGCHWVGGESFVEHDDTRELRSFGKALGGSVAYVVQIRTTRQAPVACPGWHVVDMPRLGLVKVTR